MFLAHKRALLPARRFLWHRRPQEAGNFDWKPAAWFVLRGLSVAGWKRKDASTSWALGSPCYVGKGRAVPAPNDDGQPSKDVRMNLKRRERERETGKGRGFIFNLDRRQNFTSCSGVWGGGGATDFPQICMMRGQERRIWKAETTEVAKR